LRVLTVARLVEVKGLEYAIRAVAKVAKWHPQIRYQIVGDGPLGGPLCALATDLGVADRVEFLGERNQSEVIGLMADAHLCILPSVVGSDGAEEGQGGVLTEAQAMRLPVVGTAVGGLPETVVDGESGLLVQQRDPDALADALERLIKSQDRWAEMGAAGRRHVEQHFDVDKLNDQLVEIYQQVLDEH
jgi:colanic acid/amylovoran biosynthesis glycosyltransferase